MTAVYVCAELSGTQCLAWVERASILPPLTIQQGAELGSLVLLCYAAAWGCSIVARQFLNR